jgi:hypothetical protein
VSTNTRIDTSMILPDMLMPERVSTEYQELLQVLLSNVSCTLTQGVIIAAEQEINCRYSETKES